MILNYPCRFYSVIVGLRAPKKIHGIDSGRDLRG
jgi:hypothetical protein